MDNLKYSKVKVTISTTHGINLTDKHIEYLKKYDGFVSFSLDGTPETHLRNRSARNLEINSYDQLIASFKKAKEVLVCSANATVTPDGNLAKDLFHIYDLGFRIITMLPVRPAESEIYTLNSEFTSLMKFHYASLISALKSLPEEKLIGVLTSLTTEDYFNKFFARIVFGENYHRKCGAGFNFIFVSSDGTLTPCSSFRPYQGKQYILGSLEKGIDLKKIEPLFSFSTLLNEPCKSCRVEKVCSGFCFFNSFQTNAIVNKPAAQECELAIFVIDELNSFYQYLKKEKPQVLQAYVGHFEKISNIHRNYYDGKVQ